MALRLGKRLLVFAGTFFAASLLIFGLLAIVPGDPAQVALGVNATPEALAQMRAEFGTDRPLPAQYLSWISGLLTGDFGTAYISRAPIGPQIMARAREAAQLEHEQLLSQLKREFGRMVADATSRVTGKVLNNDDQSRINQEAAAQVAQ